MDVSVRQREGVTILDLEGRITIGSGGTDLRSAVQGAMNGGATKILLNLQDVTRIDSSGVGELVSAHTTATNRGIKLALVNAPERIDEVLRIAQLLTVFDVYATEDEAIQSF
jgi:anti-sigma B factor antagonist